MKKDKLRVIIIAVVIVAALVAGLLSLKIEPANPTADSPSPAVSESVTNSPENSENPVEIPENSTGNSVKPEENTPDPSESVQPEERETPSETPLPVTSTVPGEETPASSTPSPTPIPTSSASDDASIPPSPTPTPSFTPEPEEKGSVCTVEIRCDTVMDTSVIENEAVIPYLPANGVVLVETEVEFEEGETAFDILNRVCREKNIQMEFRKDGAYSGNYIEGINYLYEFDAGTLSGWMYKVNEKFPNYGCSNYKMQPGDKMVWVYTTDLGRDVGDNSEW